MPELDIDQALNFLDMLDLGGRHTIASEAPFGSKENGPKWEQGRTYEAHQLQYLIEDIQERQARKSNVYYSVNKACSASDQHGWNGKCIADDIVTVRALAFDIDFTVKSTPQIADSLLGFIDAQLTGELRPSLVVDSGGGFQLIYLLKEHINIQLYRPAINAEQEGENEQVRVNRSAIKRLADEFEALLRSMVPQSLPVKIDNMSNMDRVMRPPGTVNHPKCDLYALRRRVPRGVEAPSVKGTTPYVPRPNPQWPPFRKAKTCCQFICDRGLADSNEDYTLHVMLPLLGAMRDGELDMAEAEECFLLAVSGGERYGKDGRGEGYFRRQWRSHLNSSRNGHRTLATLIYVCKENGMALPWSDAVLWEDSFESQRKELAELKQTISAEDMDYAKS